MINAHMKTNAQGGGDQMMYLAGKVTEQLDRKGIRQHPLAYDLCHSVLVELMEIGLRGNVAAQVASLVQKAIDDELAYMDQRVLWVDLT